MAKTMTLFFIIGTIGCNSSISLCMARQHSSFGNKKRYLEL